MSSFVPSVLDNLRFTHDMVATIRAVGEGRSKQDLFKERAPDVLESSARTPIRSREPEMGAQLGNGVGETM